MSVAIYAGIFICKIIEDALSTLRIIVVANGKKVAGAILQFIIALIWVVVTGTVITNIQEDPWKILFFALGSLVGSYIGSYIEEKIALGTNVFMVEVEEGVVSQLIKKIKKQKFKVNSVKGSKEGKVLLMITSPRKKTNDVTKIIRSFDEEAVIISEKVKVVSPHI